jgi:hypothetical protein
MPPVANHVPHMNITWDEGRIRLKPEEASRLLKAGRPSIIIGGGKEGSEGRPGLVMNSFQLQAGEEKIVAEQIVQLFRAHAA